MSDDDLIRRGDARRVMLAYASSYSAEEAETAIAALPAVTPGVKVKPLVWQPSILGRPWHSAKAPWGWYYVQWDDEVKAYFASLELGETLTGFEDPDAAKAAAQADYEARILAAIDLTPLPSPDVARLVEAVKYLDRSYETEYAGRMYEICTGCNAQLSEDKPHAANCAWRRIDAALAAMEGKP